MKQNFDFFLAEHGGKNDNEKVTLLPRITMGMVGHLLNE